MTPAAAPPAPVEAAAERAAALCELAEIDAALLPDTHAQRQAAYAATRPPIRALMAKLDAERVRRHGR